MLIATKLGSRAIASADRGRANSTHDVSRDSRRRDGTAALHVHACRFGCINKMRPRKIIDFNFFKHLCWSRRPSASSSDAAALSKPYGHLPLHSLFQYDHAPAPASASSSTPSNKPRPSSAPSTTSLLSASCKSASSVSCISGPRDAKGVCALSAGALASLCLSVSACALPCARSSLT